MDSFLPLLAYEQEVGGKIEFAYFLGGGGERKNLGRFEKAGRVESRQKGKSEGKRALAS